MESDSTEQVSRNPANCVSSCSSEDDAEIPPLELIIGYGNFIPLCQGISTPMGGLLAEELTQRRDSFHRKKEMYDGVRAREKANVDCKKYIDQENHTRFDKEKDVEKEKDLFKGDHYNFITLEESSGINISGKNREVRALISVNMLNTCDHLRRRCGGTPFSEEKAKHITEIARRFGMCAAMDSIVGFLQGDHPGIRVEYMVDAIVEIVDVCEDSEFRVQC